MTELKLNGTYLTIGGYFVEIVYIQHNRKYPYFGHLHYANAAYYETEHEVMPISFDLELRNSNRDESVFDIAEETFLPVFYKPYLEKEDVFVMEESYYYHLKPEFMVGYADSVRKILAKRSSKYWSDVLAYIEDTNAPKGELSEIP